MFIFYFLPPPPPPPAIWSELCSRPAHPRICLCCRWNRFAVTCRVDLLSKNKRTFLSADKCTRTYNGVISITGAILDRAQGCLLADLLVSSCVLRGLPHASCDPAKVRPVVTGKITRNWIWNTAGKFSCCLYSCATSRCSYLWDHFSPQMFQMKLARYSKCGKTINGGSYWENRMWKYLTWICKMNRAWIWNPPVKEDLPKQMGGVGLGFPQGGTHETTAWTDSL